MRPGLAAQRHAILGVLMATAALAWAMLATHRAWPGMDMSSSAPTMGLPAPAFLAVWIIMMVAMMFPAAAPMVLTFHRVQASRGGGAFTLTWVFLAGYMLVWTLAGIVAGTAARGAEAMGDAAALSPVLSARIGGVLLVLAGLYQLTPLKNACLAKCRTPLSFIMGAWRGGTVGALHMGLLHGAYCLGCCWLLFVILFPLGLMSLVAMAALTVLICAEKLPWGRASGRVAAGALVLYGAVVIILPRALPTYTDGMTMPMTEMPMP